MKIINIYSSDLYGINCINVIVISIDLRLRFAITYFKNVAMSSRFFLMLLTQQVQCIQIEQSNGVSTTEFAAGTRPESKTKKILIARKNSVIFVF